MSTTWQSRSTEAHLMHFSLPQVEASQELTLNVCLQRFPLQRHNEQTRLQARQAHGFLRHASDRDLTHYIDVRLPTDAVALMEVTRPTMVDGVIAEQTVHMGIHLPRRGLRKAIQLIRESDTSPDVHPKLARFAHLLKTDGEAADLYPQDLSAWQTPVDSAEALIFTHPDIIYLDAKGGEDEMPGYIVNKWVAAALNHTGELEYEIEKLGDRWIKTERALGPDGEALSDDKGQPVFTRILHPNVRRALGGTVALAVKWVKQDEKLRGVKWTQQYGKTTDSYAASASDGAAPHATLLAAEEAVAAAGPYKWSLANRTPGSGLSVDPNLRFAPAPQQQVFNTTDTWLSADPAPTALSSEVVKELLAGRVFVQLSTPEYANGLLRAQLVPKGTVEEGKEVEFEAVFSGASTVPPVSTEASATGTFRLNDLRTAMTFTISAKKLGASPSGVLGIGAAGERGTGVRPFTIADDSAYGTLTLTCTNEWLRHLSACVRYLDETGKVIEPKNWSEKIPGGLRPIFQQDPNTKFLDLVSPVRTVFAIPIPPDPTEISIPVPENARTIQVYFGGLGSGGSYDTAICPVGVAVTVVAEMAVPMILLIAGTAVTNSKTMVDLIANKEVLFAVCTVAGFLVAGSSAAYIGTSQDPSSAVKDVAIRLGPMLLSPATALGQYLLKKVAEGAAQRAVPFFNVFATVVNTAVTAAQLCQTSIEVASSPWVFNAEITRAIDLEVTLHPDDRYKRFPDLAKTYAVSVVYDKGATLPKQVFELKNGPPWSNPIKVKFSQVPAGGRLKVYVFFYAENGWQAGQGESPWLDAKGTDGSTLVINRLQITTNEVPLGTWSVYRHASKIAYDRAKGAYYWLATKTPPTATATTPSPHPEKSIQRLLSITTAQRPAMMAYSWQATGLNQPLDDASKAPTNQSMYTLQNLSTLEDPGSAYATPPVGFNNAPGVFYDLASPEDGSGRNFFADATRGNFHAADNPAGGMHIRRVALTYRGKPPTFATRSNESWGRFPLPMDRYILHPQGIVLGINYSTHKIFILRLPVKPTTDDKAPIATMSAGEGWREGMLNGPRAIASGVDGRVLVLEGGNDRIQAFDVEGKPVAYFKDPDGGSAKLSTMKLREPENSTYLDLAVEAKGYLYVLRYRGSAEPQNYRVDLYEPDGQFLVSTPSVAADKITVDLLRNMFALNYEVILGKDGRTEPSVSLWIPPPPKE
ncbi:hypothetical protein [Dyella flagellata]|uniref:NHL repeat containing protein n=1 Tax=Dyella flagellata TaxID=1867833 RepID=A0ABQ5XAP3_9GAMM|nr:hypothetical protein [Dyella flagellata]GLQ87688.1 hypothetical protein GCM10007898_12550 [Dyella flagellata]